MDVHRERVRGSFIFEQSCKLNEETLNREASVNKSDIDNDID